MKRMLLVAGTTLGAVLASTAPAHAAYEGGDRFCGPNQTGRSHSDTTGFTEHYPPGSGYKAFANGSTRMQRQAFANSVAGGEWAVYTPQTMWTPGTYAVCVTTGS